MTDLVAGAVFDPSHLQGNIASNTAALTLKADQATTNTKAEVNDIADGKVDDSQVLTNVPANAVFTDTVYTHPATHSTAEVTGLQAALNGKVDDGQVLTNVPVAAVFTDTVYTHPATHSIAEVSGLHAL